MARNLSRQARLVAQIIRGSGFLAEAGRMKLDVVPLSGEEVQAVVAKAFATPPAVIDLAEKAIAPPT